MWQCILGHERRHDINTLSFGILLLSSRSPGPTSQTVSVGLSTNLSYLSFLFILFFFRRSRSFLKFVLFNKIRERRSFTFSFFLNSFAENSIKKIKNLWKQYMLKIFFNWYSYYHASNICYCFWILLIIKD